MKTDTTKRATHFISKGFTFLELVIVIAIMTALAAIVLGSFSEYRKVQVIKNETEQLVLMLREARAKTLSSEGSQQYGVHIESNQAVVFEGSTYNAGDADNSVVEFDSAVTATPTLVGSGDDVVFKRLTGATETHGTILVQIAADTTKQRTITVTATGIVESN